MLFNCIFINKTADIAGNVRVSVQHTAILAVAVIQKIILEQGISAVCQGIKIISSIFQGFRCSFQTVSGLYQAAQSDCISGADHDEHDT